jgi:HD-GYP domain-containing protein (c-di-GMP phosphodiesterase class II)/HAMP domain-containing protein
MEQTSTPARRRRQQRGWPDGYGKAFSKISVQPTTALRLDARQARHLERGGTLLLDRAQTSASGLALALAFEEDRVLVGDLLAGFLYQPNRVDETDRYWVANAHGAPLFATGSHAETVSLADHHGGVEDRRPFTLPTHAGPEMAVLWPIFLETPFQAPPLRVGMARPRRTILRPLDEFRASFAASVLLAFLGSLAIGLHQVRHRLRPLNELMRVTRRIEAGDYSARVEIRSRDEFEDLAGAFNSMTREISGDIADLQTLADAGTRMLSDPDIGAVAGSLALKAVELTRARLAVVFMATPARDGSPRESDGHWRFAPLAGASVDVGLVDTRAMRPFPANEEIESTSLLLERSACAGRIGLDWSELEALAGGELERVVTMPLQLGTDRIRGLLVLAGTEPTLASLGAERTQSALRILADQGAASIRIAELITNLRNLFEGVVQLTVEAIDEKSPYTGDHCRRVPILTELLADAACAAGEGPLKDFSLSAEERYELKIAALLHDCGKVTTPVHVMDKATKLEAITDRIELVRTRAEILRRELELEHLRAALRAAGAESAIDDGALESARAALADDLAFLETCNQGGEFMAASLRERVDAIHARHAWQDTGGVRRELVTAEEAENLKISRGTLNAAERQAIEQHVTTTIRLLEQIPFPPEMRGVPFIAGAHHERLDGTGYPNRLGREQLPMQARILGLADVFEALTAKDRPYKPGRTLSETLRTMQDMVDRGHLDADLYEVFLYKKIHLHYAAEHMDPHQIDGPHQAELEQLSAPWSPALPSRSDSQGASSP